MSVWLPGCVSVSLATHRKTHLFSLSHMTSSGETEHSYLRVYRTNIANHLPEGVLKSSLVQAESLESEQPPFLQRTLGTETPGPRSSPEARTLWKGKVGRGMDGLQLSPEDRNTGK